MLELLLVLLIVAAITTAASSKGRLTLVLTKFEVRDNPRDNVYVDLEGRAAGLLHWFLHLLGLMYHTTLKVTDREVHLDSASVFAHLKRTVPLKSVSSTDCGYFKPLALIITAVIELIAGPQLILKAHGSDAKAMLFFGVMLVMLAIIQIIAYALQKSIRIGIQTHGSTTYSVRFRRSIIENVAMDIDYAEKAIRILNNLVSKAQMDSRGEYSAPVQHITVATQSGGAGSFGASVETRLAELRHLRDTGVISEEEFQNRRSKIIESI
jgi:hypothetical protein